MKPRIENSSPFKAIRRAADGRTDAELQKSIFEKKQKGDKLDEVETEFLKELREDDRLDANPHFGH